MKIGILGLGGIGGFVGVPLAKYYNEDENMEIFTSNADAQMYFDTQASPEEVLYNIVDNNDGSFTLNTVIYTDSNNDGTPDYLDANVN